MLIEREHLFSFLSKRALALPDNASSAASNTQYRIQYFSKI